jgi:DNA helicase-2/ATP-dependent DNA helicase PcrA
MPPNEEQRRLAALPVGNVLAIAPAGCGKTEALAERARAVLERRGVVAPRKLLALSFSNKARDNLARRMRTIVGSGWQQRISVTNFHGLSGRLIRSHGAAIGIDPTVIFPEEPWRREARKRLGISWANRNVETFDNALAYAKSGALDDVEVMRRLEEYGFDAAIAYELMLRDEGRLDYDDMVRCGARLLAVEGVARLYRAHFGMTMVDEVQDLTVMQYEMVRAVGGDTVTYAGDPAQGIYTFAGADPSEVFARIRALDPQVVEFNQSYRSAPAVLRAVNGLAAIMGSTELFCATPERWPDEGHVISIERRNRSEEAAAVAVLIEQLTADPNLTVGVVGRTATRSNELKIAVHGRGIDFEDWGLPTHVPGVVSLLRTYATPDTFEGADGVDALDRLEDRCREVVDASDVETLNELAAALDALREMVASGATIDEAVASCRPTANPGEPVGPGVHVLTGHKGKGQEFDWVVIVGLEEGQVPAWQSKTSDEIAEELRVLHVMASRARYGLAFTYARHDGRYSTTESRWLDLLRAHATHSDHA